MEKITLQYLLKRYRAGTCTSEEKALIESWYNSLDKQDGAFDNENLLNIGDAIWHQVAAKTGINDVKRAKTNRYNFTIAAAVLVFVLTGAWFVITKRNVRHIVPQTVKNNIIPGGNKAILTLANGRKINLSDAGTGKIAKQGNTNISKTADGKLLYAADELTARNGAPAVELNTIETPRGGQYQIDLPDGTKVWLNAASSLKYPAQFTGNQRNVTLNGEAYFEVAPDKLKPFIVNSGKQAVKVLGTHFNINAYNDEPVITTTLLKGSVLVTQENTHQTSLLKPGQQAQVADDIKVSKADVDEAVAWKNGMIKFSNQDIKSVMRIIARWYNVDIIYKGNISNIGFGGSVSRSMKISEILKVLETTGYVHFKITGRSVTVMP